MARAYAEMIKVDLLHVKEFRALVQTAYRLAETTRCMIDAIEAKDKDIPYEAARKALDDFRKLEIRADAMMPEE